METAQIGHDLLAKSWRSSKELTAAVQDTALQQGKRAVVKTKGGTFRKYMCASSTCSWFVNASLSRYKQRESSWHVTTSNLEHINCTGVPRPTQRQVVASTVMRSSVAADNSASVPSLSDQLKMQAGFQCKPSMVSRAKEQILEGMFAEDSASIQLLPSYLSELTRRNCNLHTEIQRDSSGRFNRAIVVLDSKLFTNGQQIFGVDGAHMKHRNYNGVQLILVARDGNMENKIASVALVPVENAENYKWFFGVLLSRGFILSTTPVFSDRHAGILAAAEALSIRVFFCTRHIIGTADLLLSC